MSFTNIDDPSAHFQIATWTGNATARNITNDGNSDLQPDFIWMKCRDSNTAHIWQLSNLGVTKYFRSNVTSAIATASSLISSFNTDGFGITNNSSNNVNTEKNVAWQWKAGGNSTSSNTDGDITSTIQTNSTAGFTMGTYTGNGSDNQTIGHGLGAKPNWIIVKRKDTAAAWLVWHEDNSANHVLRFYTNTETDSASGRVSARASNSRGSSTIFTVYQGSSAYDNCNINGDTYVFWAWAEKQGYSKFGSYTGNGSTTNGPFAYTGFKPAFVMIKARDATKNWVVLDHKRNFNGDRYTMYADTTSPDVETPSSGGHIDFLSNGFKIYDNWSLTNQNNIAYVYMAFAENPFVTSTGIMGTAR
jgi:hypothetical protein